MSSETVYIEPTQRQRHTQKQALLFTFSNICIEPFVTFPRALHIYSRNLFSDLVNGAKQTNLNYFTAKRT